MAERKQQPGGIPARIRAAIAYSGLTQPQVAAKLNGVSPEALGRWARGAKEGRGPEPNELRGIAAATGVPPAFFDVGFRPLEDYDEAAAEKTFGERLAVVEQVVMAMAKPTSDVGARALQDAALQALERVVRKPPDGPRSATPEEAGGAQGTD